MKSTHKRNHPMPFGRCWAISFLLLLTACSGETSFEKLRQAMYDQPRYEPLEASPFFEDGRSARPMVPGTVARGQLREDTHFYTGKGPDGEPVDSFPYPVTTGMLEKGQERFNIFCSPCHDRAGTGYGMIIKRGFKKPPSLHIPRLREIQVGHLYDVITNGFGTMYSYASRIPPRDRWAIVAYIRALQLSQRATLSDVPEAFRVQLQKEDSEN